MGWREEREKALRSKPITQQDVQAEDKTRQNDFKNEGGSFNPLHWIEEVENLAGEFSRRDPRGGCWEWVKRNLDDKWQGVMTAMREIDAAFQEQRADRVCKAIIQARSLYHEIVEAWDSRPNNVSNS